MSAPSRPVIEARGLSVAAGTRLLLDNVSFEIGAGERVAIVGHNGAGKSTLLRTLTGFVMASEGALRILDTEVGRIRDDQGLRALRCRVANIHQGLHLVARLSALDNVLIGGAGRCAAPRSWLRRWPANERHDAHEALRRVGMAWAERRRADTLSGGERQKIAVARALHQHAPILLADEPTASLDADAADELASLLAGLAVEHRSTLLCVVHDLDLLPRLADRAIVLRHGTIAADLPVSSKTPEELRSLMK